MWPSCKHEKNQLTQEMAELRKDPDSLSLFFFGKTLILDDIFELLLIPPLTSGFASHLWICNYVRNQLSYFLKLVELKLLKLMYPN